MWLITPIGFFSIVEKPQDTAADKLTVRARVRADLERLREQYLPSLTEIEEWGATDYRFRAHALRAEIAEAAAQMIKALHYNNFKTEVSKRQGSKRAQLYHDVWSALYPLQEGESFQEPSAKTASSKTKERAEIGRSGPLPHPKPRPNGQIEVITKRSQPSAPETWDDWQAVATWTPESRTPNAINGVAIQALHERRATLNLHEHADAYTFDEPAFEPPAGLAPAAGAVVVEPHGRVWIVHPTNQFGGYRALFPKGRAERTRSLRETAVGEVFEEAGIIVQLFDFLIDMKRSETLTRYYLARRVDGSPADMSWESQAVSLVPLTKLETLLNRSVDKQIARALHAREAEWGRWFGGERGPVVDGHMVATRYTWERQPMPDRRTRIALDFRLTADEADRVRRGLVPAEMEQHWFAYFEDNVLHWHRSWTGFYIYRVQFVDDGEGLRATEMLVNREFRQYENTNDERDRREIEALTRELAGMVENEDMFDHTAKMFERMLSAKNYLGSPTIVGRLAQEYIGISVAQALPANVPAEQRATHEELAAANARISRIFSGEDPDYTTIGSWNSAEELGATVRRCFDLDPDYFEDENLLCLLSEGLMGVTVACRTLVKATVDGKADWEVEVQPRLQQIVHFVTAVLMGTHSVFFPGKTLQDLTSLDDAG